jgi:hypothetical protein
LINRITFGEEYKSCNSTSCSLLHFSVTSSPLRPKCMLIKLLSNTLSLWSSLNVRDQDSHPLRNNSHKEYTFENKFIRNLNRIESRR